MQGSTVGLTMFGHGFGMSKGYRTDFRMKDHVQENVKRMRQIQRRCKERGSETPRPIKALDLWKSEKYKDIQSKIKEDIENEPQTPRPRSANFLRAHSRSGPTVELFSRPCTPDPTNKVTVPLAASASSVKFNRNDIDFVKVNGKSVKHIGMIRSPSLTALDDLKTKQDDEFQKHQRGAVPRYLKNRKDQWKQEEDERVANTPDPACPPGHKVLAEEERKETLSVLRKNEKELTAKLLALPLRMDTYRIRSQKEELEKKLAEIEEAVKIFNRPKVFVKVDQ